MQQPIALFIRDLRAGGAQRVFVNLSAGLARRGYQVDLIVARAEGTLCAQVDPHVHLVNLDARGALASIPRLRRYLRTRRPTVLLSTIHYVNIAALIAARLAGRSTGDSTGRSTPRAPQGTPLRVIVREANILSGDTFHPNRFRDRVLLFLMRRLYRTADAVVVNARDTRLSLVQYGVVPDHQIETIPNPLDLEQIRERAALSPAGPPVSAGPTGTVGPAGAAHPLVLGVGSLGRQKNFALLIRAFARALEHPACETGHLVILGEGEQRSELQQLAVDLRIADRVHLFGLCDNPFAWMARADAFVLSSLWEGSPNVLAEAMACGAPVIAADCPGGAGELLADGRFGLLVPCNDQPALAEAIIRIVQSPPDPEVVRSRVASFDLQSILDRYLLVMFPPEISTGSP